MLSNGEGRAARCGISRYRSRLDNLRVSRGEIINISRGFASVSRCTRQSWFRY